MLEFFESIKEFFTTGIYEWFEAALVQTATFFILQYFKWKLVVLQFSYQVAGELLNQLNVTSFIEAAWGQLDSYVLGVMTYFRIPEGINLILSASVTRFVFNFFG